MDIELSIKNYRCFQKPAVINLSKGFTALVGANNSGKSSLLKFFYEFRNMFVMLGNTSVLLDVIRGQLQPLNLLEVTDPTDIFCNQNDRNIELTFTFKPGRALNTADPVKLVITVLRNQNGWQCRLYYWEESTNRERAIDGQQDLTFETDTLLRYLGSIRISFEEILPIFGAFGRTLYIGPFRNVLNIGANPNYYDLQVGEAFVTMWRSLQTGSSTANRNATYALRACLRT